MISGQLALGTGTLEARVECPSHRGAFSLELKNKGRRTVFNVRADSGVITRLTSQPLLHPAPKASIVTFEPDEQSRVEIALMDAANKDTYTAALVEREQSPVVGWLRYTKKGISSRMRAADAFELCVASLTHSNTDFMLYLRNLQRGISYLLTSRAGSITSFESNPRVHPQPEAVINYVDRNQQRDVEILLGGGNSEDIYTIHVTIGKEGAIAQYAQWRDSDAGIFVSAGHFVQISHEQDRKGGKVRAHSEIVPVNGKYL